MTIQDVKLTQHFIDNWRKRIGGEPSPALVKKILAEAVCIQTGTLFLSLQGKEVVNTLSIYWHREQNLIIKIDNYQDRAVSILNGKNLSTIPAPISPSI
jgi:hypothetical protein